jgi:hypothetical protein
LGRNKRGWQCWEADATVASQSTNGMIDWWPFFLSWALSNAVAEIGV